MTTESSPHIEGTAERRARPDQTGPSSSERPDRTLRTVLLVLGSVIIVAMLAVAALRLVSVLGYEDQSGTFRIAEPVDRIAIRTAATEVAVAYADVDAPIVEYEQNGADLALRQSVDDGQLRVVVRSRIWGPFNWSTPRSEPAELRVILPYGSGAAAPELEVRTTAGTLEIDGEFASLEVRATAAAVWITGSAESLALTGTASELTVRDFSTDGAVEVGSTAGDVRFRAATLPSSIDVTATASEVWFELPSGEYRIDTDVTAGQVLQEVSSAVGSERRYRFSSTAGDIRLTERE